MTDKTIPEEKLYNRFIEQPLKMDSQINYYLKALSVFVGPQETCVSKATEFGGIPILLLVFHDRVMNVIAFVSHTQCEWRKSNYLFILRKLILIVSPGPERASIN